MEIKAKIRYLKTAPRKVRLVCDLIRGKKLDEAMFLLSNIKKQGAEDLLPLLKSGEANAKQKNIKSDKLFVKEIRCDMGPALKRTLIISRGRATVIKKKMSHVTVVLTDERKSKIANSKFQTNKKFKTKNSKTSLKIDN